MTTNKVSWTILSLFGRAKITDFWQFLLESATDESEKLMGKTRDPDGHFDVCINPKMSPIRDPVRGRKNAPIDCWRYTYFT